MVAAGPLAAPRRAAALAAAVALTATGCGVLKASEPEAIAQPGTVTTAPSGLSPGPYALTTEEGAVITFDLPTVPAPDDEVEQLRRDLNVEPVTYVELHIDNTEGTRTVQIDDLKVISHEGGQFPFDPAVEVLSDWDPNRSGEGGFWAADGSPLDPEEGARLDARTHELIAQYTGAVPAGASGRELMIGDFKSLPRTFDDIELSPYPNDRALDPAPVGHGPEQRQFRAGVPSPEPRERIEAVPAPEPAAPEPARPAAQPPRAQPPRAPAPAEPAPAPDAEPVYVPDCTDPSQPSGSAQQAAWSASCAPVAEPTAGPAPPPTQQPTVEPTPSASPAPPVPQQPGDSIPPAGNNDAGADPTPAPTEGGATVGASASPSPSPTGRRNWPPGPAPTPTPSASTAAPTVAPSATPSATATAEPSLPSGTEQA
ncbi:hypothetical protein [uncultured Kocuria sp.]|uniref:hypothetical protein n=1 Tax=uncultured Kocuria sp. TaxID=259305 RepID=UPI0026107933|nr:hypothetical protein [uncultured Kocuria sp.]